MLLYFVCTIGLALFMFATGVAGTLIGIAIARVILLAVVGSEGHSCHDRQSSFEGRRFSELTPAGETHGNTPTASRNSSGNVSKFRTICFNRYRRRNLRRSA